MDKYSFSGSLLALIDEMNLRAGDNPDVLAGPPGFSIMICSPPEAVGTDAGGMEAGKDAAPAIQAVLTIASESGGSEESSYAMNDRFSCLLYDDRIAGIVFERDSWPEEQPDVPLSGKATALPSKAEKGVPSAGPADEILLSEIRSFCEKKLPPPLTI
ncbi:MAG: hypothetical protein E4H36_04460 [Spirochaetales bacterium]|nr:MAG: hypothetical protein E4H36_04460 [Spirochaetales bacterium]